MYAGKVALFVLISSLESGVLATCSCSGGLPKPRVVLLGGTGVGKSSLGSRLLGISNHTGKEADCSQSEEKPHSFGVGHRSVSHTNKTTWLVGHYLGNPANPCITIIDTPGTGDTEGRDCDHAVAISKGLQEIGGIETFLLLYKGTNVRFDEAMQEELQRYQSLFGQQFFDNVVTGFTFWGHSQREISKRLKNNHLNETVKHSTWNNQYKEKLDIKQEIPSVFIDPVLDMESAEEEELDANTKYTDKLWELATRMTPYECSAHCSPPRGFFTGQPWLLKPAVERRRQGVAATFTWHVWLDGCGNSSVDGNFKLHFNGEEMVDPSAASIKIEESFLERGKLKQVKVRLEPLSFTHEGQYRLVNDQGSSDEASLLVVVDGAMGPWADYGACTKTCTPANMTSGSQERTRQCISPRNGGLPCTGALVESRPCGSQACPEWTAWSSWSACSVSCGGGLKGAERRCLPVGSTCLGTARREAACGEEHCPVDCRWSPWQPWTPCSSTCGPWSASRSRVRSVGQEAAHGGEQCQEREGVQEERCDWLNECPVAGGWASWGSWSSLGSCSRTCGGGRRTYQRTRSCTDPRPKHNGRYCSGTAVDETRRSCNSGSCPTLPNPATGWREYAPSLLCNTPGSNEHKAEVIRDRLKEAYNDANWYVFVSDNDEGVAFSKKTGNKIWHDDTCGKNMYVWTREDSLFTKTSCSDYEKRQMTNLMRAAAADGGDTAAVRDRLTRRIDNFGYDFHFVRVASDTGQWSQIGYLYTSCVTSLKSNGFMIYVYMNP